MQYFDTEVAWDLMTSGVDLRYSSLIPCWITITPLNDKGICIAMSECFLAWLTVTRVGAIWDSADLKRGEERTRMPGFVFH